MIVGSFKPAEIRSDVETYLGGLPAKGRREQWKDVGVRPPDGSQTVEVRKGIEPKSQVRMIFTTDAKWSREESHLVASLGQALRIRLREVLREDLGGVYGVGAGGGISRRPAQQSSFSISFGCSPDRVDELKKAVLEVLDAAKRDGFSSEIIEKVREQQIRSHETDLKENGYWQSVLENAERFGDDPHDVLDQDRLTKLVTSDSLRETARRYLDPKRCVTAFLSRKRPRAPRRCRPAVIGSPRRNRDPVLPAFARTIVQVDRRFTRLDRMVRASDDHGARGCSGRIHASTCG